MTRFESSREDLSLDGLALAEYEDGSCWLVVLNDWQLSVILSSLRYAHWLARWKNLGPYTWDELEAKITQMEHCLMAGCDVDALLTKFDDLITAVQGIILTCSPGLTVNCGTGGDSNGGGYGGDFGIDIEPDPGEPSAGTPPTSWEGTVEEYTAYKCKAANVLVLNLAEFLATCNVLVLNDYSLYPDNQSIIDYIGLILSNASHAIGHLLNSTAAMIGKILNCAASGGSCGEPAGTAEVTFGETTGFYDVRLMLLTDRGDAVCDLFNAETVSAARLAIINRLSGYFDLGSYSVDEETTFDNALSEYLSNIWLNRLFVSDNQIDNYSDTSAIDCDTCLEETLEVIRFDCPTFKTEAIIVSGNLVYDEWITIDSGTGYWRSTRLIDNFEIKTKDNSLHTWDSEFISGGGPSYQSAYHDTGGYGGWTNWGASTNFNRTAQTGIGLGFESGDPTNHNPPTTVFRVRVRCNS